MMSLRARQPAKTVSMNRRPKEPVPPLPRMTLPSRSREVGANRPKARSGKAANLSPFAPLVAAARKETANHNGVIATHATPRTSHPDRPPRPGHRRGPQRHLGGRREEQVGERQQEVVRRRR